MIAALKDSGSRCVEFSFLSAAIIGSPDLYYYRILGFTQIFGFYFPVFWYVIPCGPCFQALLRYDILNAGARTPVHPRAIAGFG